MKRRAVAENVLAVAKALALRGASVDMPPWNLRGGPQVVCGYHGITLLFHVGDGAALNQREWRDAWRGHVHVVENAEEALAFIDQLDAEARELRGDYSPGDFDGPCIGGLHS